MSTRKILVIDAHPDPVRSHFIHALVQAYLDGAQDHRTRVLRLAEMDFPLVRSPADWMHQPPPESIASAQSDISWADHVVLFYPLWLGDMPALLKAFLEQALRPNFAFQYVDGGFPLKLLAGRSARIVVTMGMPRLLYSLFYRAHSVRALKRNILHFVGIRRVAATIIGSVEADERRRHKWLEQIKLLGREGK